MAYCKNNLFELRWKQYVNIVEYDAANFCNKLDT